MLLTAEVERRVIVDDELLTADVVRVVDAGEVTSRVVVGLGGNVAVAEGLLLVEVDAPRTFDVETLLSLARRTADDVDVAALFEAATFDAKREELFTLRRSFSFPLL